jgi:hypothetical protein
LTTTGSTLTRTACTAIIVAQFLQRPSEHFVVHALGVRRRRIRKRPRIRRAHAQLHRSRVRRPFAIQCANHAIVYAFEFRPGVPVEQRMKSFQRDVAHIHHGARERLLGRILSATAQITVIIVDTCGFVDIAHDVVECIL